MADGSDTLGNDEKRKLRLQSQANGAAEREQRRQASRKTVSIQGKNIEKLWIMLFLGKNIASFVLWA